MKMTIYIAGPMRGVKHFNFPLFDGARNWLLDIGHEPISPADLDRIDWGFDACKVGFDDDNPSHWDSRYLPVGRSANDALARDLKILERCDAILMLPGWQKSVGARAEYQRAIDLGLRVCSYDCPTCREELPQDALCDKGNRQASCTYDSEEVGRIRTALESEPGIVAGAEEDILDEAKRLVGGDRNASYGPPNQDFQRTADMWTGLLQYKLKDKQRIRAQDVAWMMIMLKASRSQHSDKRDNYVDAAGYAHCGWRCAAEEPVERQ